MRAKLRAVKTELILLIMTAVFLFGLTGLARRDRMAADTAAVAAAQDNACFPFRQKNFIILTAAF